MNDPIGRIEHAARKIRRLRSQMGADGLTPSAARELIDELTSALDAAARALRDLSP
jgi:flagellin-like hook-associated protein FlgL